MTVGKDVRLMQIFQIGLRFDCRRDFEVEKYKNFWTLLLLNKQSIEINTQFNNFNLKIVKLCILLR